MTPYVAGSARRHGLTDEDILHAYRQPIAVWPDIGDGMDMIIGPAFNGTLIEVGVVTADDSTPIIVHAMTARRGFLPRR